MTVLSILGIIAIVIGIILVGLGIQKTQTLTNKVVEGFTGRYTERTLWILIGGGILILMGALLIYSGWQTPPYP